MSDTSDNLGFSARLDRVERVLGLPGVEGILNDKALTVAWLRAAGCDVKEVFGGAQGAAVVAVRRRAIANFLDLGWSPSRIAMALNLSTETVRREKLRR